MPPNALSDDLAMRHHRAGSVRPRLFIGTHNLQLFPAARGSAGVKTFLKVLLCLVVLVVAVKLLPLTLGLGLALGVVLAIATALGLSALAILASAAIGLITLLAPIWLPVLALIGLIALLRRSDRRDPHVPSSSGS